MKKMMILGTVLLSTAAWAAPGNGNGNGPSPNSCFGQDRAAGVHLIGGSVWGAIAAERAGDNAAQNAAYRDSCQG